MNTNDLLTALVPSLTRGSAADRAAALNAFVVGRLPPAVTATPEVLRAEQHARDVGGQSNYDAATAFGNQVAAMAQVMREAAAAQRDGANAMASAAARGTSTPSIEHQIVSNHHKAHAQAASMMEARQAVRPNRFLAMNTATPTVPIAAGAPTGVMTVNLPSLTQICGALLTDTDAENFVCSSLQVNGWESVIAGSSINGATFRAICPLEVRWLPLFAKVWRGTVTISSNWTNLSAAGLIFHGLTLPAYAPDCVFDKSMELVNIQGFDDWSAVSDRIARTIQALPPAVR